MSWGQYLLSDLDLTEESPIPSSRPYRQGRLSLDGENIFVRFIRDETPWQGGTLYESANDARGVLSSAAYTAPPTAEEIAQEKQAMSDYEKQKLLKIAERKIARKINGLPFEATYYERLRSEAQAVVDGGYVAGTSALIDDLATQRGQNLSRVADDVITDVDAITALVDAAHNIVAGGLRAIRREEDVTPFIDELRAL